MLEIVNVKEVSFTVTTHSVTYLGVCLYSMGTKHRHLRQLVVTTSRVPYFIPRANTGNCRQAKLTKLKNREIIWKRNKGE